MPLAARGFHSLFQSAISNRRLVALLLDHTHRARLVGDGWGREELTPQPGLTRPATFRAMYKMSLRPSSSILPMGERTQQPFMAMEFMEPNQSEAPHFRQAAAA